MLVLAVDTSSASGSLAVLRDEQLLGVICTTGEENYSSRMFRQLEILLGELQLKLPEFDLYAVVAGPGSFTGLRVGLAAVKGLAEVHGRPIVAVSALEAVAVQSSAPGAWVAPVLDARRGQVFGALYERVPQGLRRYQDERVETLREFLAWLASEFRENIQGVPAFVSPKPALLYFEIEGSAFVNSPVGQASPVLAPLIGQIGLERARRGEVVDALHLDANYIRRSDAELNFKAPAR
ncbi:MAG: tRNA (adenosine(37)-N6)-threonylcarbamoyltransferase complex dimerization subunit type 1 TsaB [Acidobacteria bacterium]|nr:tRNA (adenosine(37)-N6)-threonylcarbamoyltransferase complex dimerization subunit type 1 TsaB [Acidobacteriota bacterium]MBI3663744.1 tRNA (adenosine(37)-N6)-threonylcarbamoyltransferase complex dimerization subunit type 1 TsaB [Acidobacteriota bacterium]